MTMREGPKIYKRSGHKSLNIDHESAQDETCIDAPLGLCNGRVSSSRLGPRAHQTV